MKRHRTLISAAAAAGILLLATALTAGIQGKGAPPAAQQKKAVSFKTQIVPVLKLSCLPCHTEDQMNPSELYLDTYAGLMEGGKHGPAVLAGKPDSSLLIKKLGAKPPIGDPMPLKRKTLLGADTLKLIKRWILEGAKNN